MMHEQYLTYYQSPIGQLGIVETEGAITHLFFENSDKIPSNLIKETTPLLSLAITQLTEYFAGQRQQFDLPLNPSGTEFQKKVWSALVSIPYGETRSYKQVAEQVACPRGFRAVGLANNRNPIVIIIPCHRVIGHNGKLVGFGGGLPVKEYLLALEKKSSHALF